CGTGARGPRRGAGAVLSGRGTDRGRCDGRRAAPAVAAPWGVRGAARRGGAPRPASAEHDRYTRRGAEAGGRGTKRREKETQKEDVKKRRGKKAVSPSLFTSSFHVFFPRLLSTPSCLPVERPRIPLSLRPRDVHGGGQVPAP